MPASFVNNFRTWIGLLFFVDAYTSKLLILDISVHISLFTCVHFRGCTRKASLTACPIKLLMQGCTSMNRQFAKSKKTRNITSVKSKLTATHTIAARRYLAVARCCECNHILLLCKGGLCLQAAVAL